MATTIKQTMAVEPISVKARRVRSGKREVRQVWVWNKGFAFKVFKGPTAEAEANAAMADYRKENPTEKTAGVVKHIQTARDIPAGAFVTGWQAIAGDDLQATVAHFAVLFGLAKNFNKQSAQSLREKAHENYQAVNAYLRKQGKATFKGVPTMADGRLVQGKEIVGDLDTEEMNETIADIQGAADDETPEGMEE